MTPRQNANFAGLILVLTGVESSAHDHVLGAVISATAARRCQQMRGKSNAFGGEPQDQLAERVGVFDRDFAIPNVYSGFRLISRKRSDLASSDVGQRFRPFAGFADFSISMALDMALAEVSFRDDRVERHQRLPTR